MKTLRIVFLSFLAFTLLALAQTGPGTSNYASGSGSGGAAIFSGITITPKCAATGTSASPSVVSCGATTAGAFSCAVAASGGTCTVNTSAVTSTSIINVWPVSDEGSVLGVTCASGGNFSSAVAIVEATKTPGVGFTINLPNFSTNPACYDFVIF